MSGRWWRAYSRARHDPKLLKLSDKHFRWWFSLVCAAADNDGILPPHADLAVEFRTSGKAMTAVLDALITAGLFDHDETGIHPHNWNGLQYKSDVSNERVKRFRERQRNAECNVTETPSESETETDSSEAKASGGKPPADPVKELWDDGVRLLTTHGTNERNARGKIGDWRKKFGDERTHAGIKAAREQAVSEPIGWISKWLKAPSNAAAPRTAEEALSQIEGWKGLA